MDSLTPLSPDTAYPDTKKVGRPPHEVIGSLPPDIARHQVLDVKQTAAFIGFSVPQLRRLYREKKIPEPLKLSARKLGWRVGTLIDWLETRQSRPAA